MELSGYINDQCELLVFNKENLYQWIRRNKEKPVKVKFFADAKPRSVQQNRYYWGCVVYMIQSRLTELGHEVTEEQTHEFLKSRFNSKEKEVGDGLYIDVPQTTTDLLTTEFDTYLEKIKQFASQVLEIYIPEPNEQLFFNY